MKQSIYKFLNLACCGLVLAGVSSCNEDFLETTQYDIVASNAKFESDLNAKMALTGVYKMMGPDMGNVNEGDGDWGFKPNLFTGCHPTMDTQATGWDKDWNSQNWSAGSKELYDGWKHAYVAISRANEFLTELQGVGSNTGISDKVRKSLEGEAHALRGFFFHWLASTFGRVPMLSTGETYTNTPTKARAKTYEEMWNFIIEDFKTAAELLEWKPLDGEYGRCTKGMALSYLGDAYMWKAYRCPDKKTECLNEAKKVLNQVLTEGPYELAESFTTLWDCGQAWPKEAIWQEINDNGADWSQGDNNLLTATMFTKFYCACPENGGWGSLYLSWEWWASYEQGDKRRDASGCTGEVPDIRPEWKSTTSYGVHPYLGEKIGKEKESKTKQYHFTNGEFAPAIWSMKLWRNASAQTDAWGNGRNQPVHIYWKRLANVMLDYAECCFETGEEAKGWEQIDKLRNRAFGNLEVGKKEELTNTFLPAINYMRRVYKTDELTEYPIPFNEATVTVPDAKTYYTALAQSGPTWFEASERKPFKSPAWKVALNMERRKEFNCEWCLRPDMQRSGFIAEHIDVNYPARNQSDSEIANSPWSNKTFTYNDAKMDMPIPEGEMTSNPDCDQNEAYLGSSK